MTEALVFPKGSSAASLLPLLGYPLKMSREGVVPPQCFECIQFPSERHFVVLTMNAAMAQPANAHARL